MEYNSFYKTAGQGKTLVLLHGFLESCEVWNYIISALKTDFKLIVPDLLGHGKTPAMADIHTMEMMADAVFSVLKREKIDKATFIGHSMGGYVSLAFAEKYPQLLDGIILMNSTPLPDSDEKKANRERVIEAVEQDRTFFIRNAVTNLFSDENKIQMKKQIEEIIKIAQQTPNQGIKAASLGMKERPNRTDVLKKLSVPVHLIIGKNDALIPHKELIALAENLQISYSLLDGGHMSYIENQSETIEILKQIVNN